MYSSNQIKPLLKILPTKKSLSLWPLLGELYPTFEPVLKLSQRIKERILVYTFCENSITLKAKPKKTTGQILLWTLMQKSSKSAVHI